MAQRVEEGGSGWPLGLHPLNARVGGFLRNRELSESISFSTSMLTASPTSSTVSSSDLDTESTGSFYHDKSITLGSLLGVRNILELSRRSSRIRTMETSRDRKNPRSSSNSRPWFFSLCSKLSTDAVAIDNNAPSLGYFLEAERRAATIFKRNQMALPLTQSQPHSLSLVAYDARKHQKAGQDENGYGVPLLLSCLRRQLIG